MAGRERRLISSREHSFAYTLKNFKLFTAITIKLWGLLGGEVEKASGRRLLAGRVSILAVKLPSAAPGDGHQTTRHHFVSGWLHWGLPARRRVPMR